MIVTPNPHLVLHKEPLKQHLENRKFIKCFSKIFDLVTINGPVEWNGLIISDWGKYFFSFGC